MPKANHTPDWIIANLAVDRYAALMKIKEIAAKTRQQMLLPDCEERVAQLELALHEIEMVVHSATR